MTGSGTGYVDQYGDPVMPPQYDLPLVDPNAALDLTPSLPEPSYSGPMTLPGT